MHSLEERLGYTFRDKSLLQTALTHSSYANQAGTQSYERLEFLGDAILDMVAAREILLRYPTMPEGEMTRLRADLVCEGALYDVSVALGLRNLIRLGRNEECNGGRGRVSIQADVIEAIIAAMYLDGGAEPAEHFVCAHVLPELLEGHPPQHGDFKSQLQEVTQRGGGTTPVYTIVDESGPDHKKSFTARVLLPGGLYADGIGNSKKQAEQQAARAALALLKQ